jgi:hypothetical protein
MLAKKFKKNIILASYLKWFLGNYTNQLMKERISFILFFIIVQLMATNAQSDFRFLPQGAYRSVYNFRNLDPFYTNEIIFSSNAYDTTDHAYYIKTYNKEAGLTKKSARDEIFAIYQNSSLYLNCYRFSMGAGFTKVLSNGRFCYFNGCGYYNEKSAGPVMGVAVIGGAVGVSVGAGIGHFVNIKDYIVDLNTGNFHPLDSNYVSWILESEVDLSKQFKVESDKTSIDLLLHYVDLINERSKIDFLKK